MNKLQSHQNNNNTEPVCKQIDNYVFYFADYLGEGGFSKVYKGTHMITKQQVAIKITELNSLKSKKLAELLASEIDVLKKLSHPNILKCHEVLSSKQHCYIITELCNGGDLQSKLKQQKYFSEKAAKPLIRDILLGMLYLQQNNIVHRDLKVANVFLHNGSVKVADFGFAKITKQNFKDVNIGSPIYMAPQGLINHWYGPKTDVWAFGILIFELLHGKTPFSHCKAEEELKQEIMRPINQDSFRKGISQEIIQTIKKCLQISQQKRPTFTQLSHLPYFKKILKGSMHLGSNTEKLIQYNSMHHLQHINNDYQTKKLSSYGRIIQDETSQKLRSNSSHKILQSPHRLDNLKTNKKKHDSYLRVNTSRSNEKSHSKSKGTHKYGRHLDRQNGMQQMNAKNNNIGKFLSQKQYFSTHDDPKSKLVPEYPNSKKYMQSKHNQYVSNKKLLIQPHSYIFPKSPNPVPQKNQPTQQIAQNKNQQHNLDHLSEILTQIYSTKQLPPKQEQTHQNQHEKYQKKMKNPYYLPSRISPTKEDIKNTTVTYHNSNLTSKTSNQNIEQQKNQRTNRMKTKQFWDYHSKLILWPKLKYKESIGVLHYCRLFYKFIMLVRNAISSLKKQSKSPQKNKFKKGSKDDEKKIILESSMKNQLDLYGRWVVTLLEEMREKIDRNDIIYDGEVLHKENKLRNVCHEYHEKYCANLHINRHQLPLLKADAKPSGIKIQKSLEVLYHSIQRQIAKTKHSDQAYILLAHYLLIMQDSTKKLNEGLQSGSLHENQNSQIQKFLNRNQETFDMHSYVLMKRKYLSEKFEKRGSNPGSNKSSVFLDKVFHEV